MFYNRIPSNILTFNTYLHIMPSECSLATAVTISDIQCLIQVSGIWICSDLLAASSSSLKTSDTVLCRDRGGDVNSCSIEAERHSSLEFNRFNDNLAGETMFLFSVVLTKVEDLDVFLLSFSVNKSSTGEATSVSFLSQRASCTGGGLPLAVWHLLWSMLDPEELLSPFRWIS